MAIAKKAAPKKTAAKKTAQKKAAVTAQKTKTRKPKERPEGAVGRPTEIVGKMRKTIDFKGSTVSYIETHLKKSGREVEVSPFVRELVEQWEETQRKKK